MKSIVAFLKKFMKEFVLACFSKIKKFLKESFVDFKKQLCYRNMLHIFYDIEFHSVELQKHQKRKILRHLMTILHHEKRKNIQMHMLCVPWKKKARAVVCWGKEVFVGEGGCSSEGNGEKIKKGEKLECIPNIVNRCVFCSTPIF